MRSTNERWIAVVILTLAVSAATAVAQIQVQGVIGSGATAAGGGTIGLVGTVGQTIIGPVSKAGLTDNQGFWYAAIPVVAAGVEDGNTTLVAAAALSASRNPFSTETELRVQLVRSGRVSLRLYDALGREIRTLIDDVREAGPHTVMLDATELESGSYLAQLVAGETRTSLHLVVVK